MTDEQLAAIREWLQQASEPCGNDACIGEWAAVHGRALLAEVERLRAENAALTIDAELGRMVQEYSDATIEPLAALEHEQWAHWTSYMLNHLTPENIARWQRQIETPYEQLTPKEKNSDREWAERALVTLRESLQVEPAVQANDHRTTELFPGEFKLVSFVYESGASIRVSYMPRPPQGIPGVDRIRLTVTDSDGNSYWWAMTAAEANNMSDALREAAMHDWNRVQHKAKVRP